MKDSRILLYILVSLILVGLIGLVGQIYTGSSPVLEMMELWGFQLALVGSLIVLAAHSTLFKSWTAVLVAPGILIALAGVLFKIMHWPLANKMLLIGGIVIPIGYTLRFVLKRPITRNAVLKWLFVVFYSLFALGTIFHWSGFFREWVFVSRILLLVATLDFLVTQGYLQPKSSQRREAL